MDYLLQGLWSEKYINDYMPVAMKHAVAMGPWARRSGSFGLLSLGIVYSMIREKNQGWQKLPEAGSQANCWMKQIYGDQAWIAEGRTWSWAH